MAPKASRRWLLTRGYPARRLSVIEGGNDPTRVVHEEVAREIKRQIDEGETWHHELAGMGREEVLFVAAGLLAHLEATVGEANR